MNLLQHIQKGVSEAVEKLYSHNIAPENIICSTTRKEFTGDYTVTVFNIAKLAGKAPQIVGNELGEYIVKHVKNINAFNVIQGFLNLSVADAFWTNFVSSEQLALSHEPNTQKLKAQSSKLKVDKVMIEYSSPNTNKPLHLGHARNILLGWSCSRILEQAGYEVVRTKVVNDRGIAICKSMLSWQLFGNNSTPESTGIKGDLFVGNYYVNFEKSFQEEYKIWQQTPEAQKLFTVRKKPETTDEKTFFKEYKNDYFNSASTLGKQARDMLVRWEAGDKATRDLWQTMNSWVYAGFNETYKKLGVRFDKIYYESDQYELGKEIIEANIATGIFYRKPDSSVWIDLTDVKLDHKLVLRSDGTSVYITQDISMAALRDSEFHAQKVVYVVGEEQNYHFQVLFEILKKLKAPYAAGLHHLSYAFVELPEGKMKSREGTVVDADDLIDEVIAEAHRETLERGTLQGIPEAEKNEIIRRIGLGALKYQIIKVNPKKKIVFDPKESVDFEGNTGPYIQYAFVRASGVVKEAERQNIDFGTTDNGQRTTDDKKNISSSVVHRPLSVVQLKNEERDLIQLLYGFDKTVEEAAANYDPSVIANYCYDLAKSFNRFWHECKILKEEQTNLQRLRLQISNLTAHTLQTGMNLLGIEMPARM